jgi:hypothetical protein
MLAGIRPGSIVVRATHDNTQGRHRTGRGE